MYFFQHIYIYMLHYNSYSIDIIENATVCINKIFGLYFNLVNWEEKYLKKTGERIGYRGQGKDYEKI